MAEQIQERLDGLAVPAGTGPHQPAGVVINHDGEVALPLADRDLIDPDPLQAGEHVARGAGLVADALADPADRSPCDTDQLRDRGLRRLHGEPRDLIFELASKARVMAGPWHRRDDHAVLTAAHARCLRLQVGDRGAEIQRPPPPAALAPVIAGASTPAVRAAIPFPGDRTNRHDQGTVLGEPDVLNDGSLEPEELLPYASSAHAATRPSSRFQPL